MEAQHPAVRGGLCGHVGGGRRRRAPRPRRPVVTGKARRWDPQDWQALVPVSCPHGWAGRLSRTVKSRDRPQSSDPGSLPPQTDY